MKWREQDYAMRATNRRYRTPFRDTNLGWTLQFIVIFAVVFLVAVRVG